MDGLRQANPAIAIAAIAISSDGPRLVPSALFHGARCQQAAERKIEQIETLQAERHHRADEADRKRAGDHPRAARALPDPGREEHAADADEQPEIDPDPRQPDQDGETR